jgi:hypothetical protein
VVVDISGLTKYILWDFWYLYVDGTKLALGGGGEDWKEFYAEIYLKPDLTVIQYNQIRVKS